MYNPVYSQQFKMIPFLSLESLSSLNHYKSYTSNSTLPPSFLFECLKTSEGNNNFGDTPDISILSVDCMNSQDSAMRNRINLLYEDAARSIITISNKYFKSQCLGGWKKILKRKRNDNQIKNLATGIVRLSYLMNKKLQCIYLPVFINIQASTRNKNKIQNKNLNTQFKLQSVKDKLQTLVDTVEIVQNKYYKYQKMRDGFDSLRVSIKDNHYQHTKNIINTFVNNIQNSMRVSKIRFIQALKRNNKQYQKVSLFSQTINYLINKQNQKLKGQSFAQIKSYKDYYRSNGISTKSSAVQSINKRTMSSGIYTNEFKRSTDSLPKYFETISSSTKLTKTRYNNFRSQVKFKECNEMDVQQPEEVDSIIETRKGRFSSNKLTKGDLKFSSPNRSKSKGKSPVPTSSSIQSAPSIKANFNLTTSKTIIMNLPYHRPMNIESIQVMRPIQCNFNNQTRICPLYHLQKDTIFSEVQDLADNPQLFQLFQADPKTSMTLNINKNHRSESRTSMMSRSDKKSLQFKSKVGSPVHFKEIVSPKMFGQRSRQNSQEKYKLNFKRPSTSKKSVKKQVQFQIPSSPKHEIFSINKHAEGGLVRREINRIRVQSPFIQQKSSLRKDLIFDTKAYFKD